MVDIGALMACASDAEVSAALREDHAELGRVISEVRAAAAEWGFFYIRNHGVGAEQMRRFQSAMRAFFALPVELKEPLRRSASNSRGWFNSELTKQRVDWKEGLDMGGPQEDGPPDERVYRRMVDDCNQWPAEDALPGFRAAMRSYFADMTHIARRLVQVLAVALGERADFFDQFFHEELTVSKEEGEKTIHDHSSLFRLNHYPVAPEPDKTMGVHHHTDAGALTVLLQDDDVASLQAFHRDSQTWVLVPPIKDTFVINVGDMTQVWSNDKFVAPLHRVLANGARERFSAPFFYQPSYRAIVEPIVVQEDEKPRYRGVSWHDFRLRRFQGDYADHGEEVQIAHYRIDA